MRPFAAIAASILALASLDASAQYKGSVKPNWGLADFTKHDEAYYLSLDQIRLGWTENQVVEEFGKKFKESSYVDSAGITRKVYRYQSYRARMMSDPVDSIVTVEFVDGRVVGAKQVPAPGSDVVANELKPGTPNEPGKSAARLTELKALLDQKLITPEEYETKRKALIDGI